MLPPFAWEIEEAMRGCARRVKFDALDTDTAELERNPV
jgi:hypothetical protein